MAGERAPRCRVHDIPMNRIGPGGRTTVCPACVGSIRTPRKTQSSRQNVSFARTLATTNRLCRKCRKSRLAVTNRSGVCRNCQRHPRN